MRGEYSQHQQINSFEAICRTKRAFTRSKILRQWLNLYNSRNLICYCEDWRRFTPWANSFTCRYVALLLLWENSSKHGKQSLLRTTLSRIFWVCFPDGFSFFLFNFCFQPQQTSVIPDFSKNINSSIFLGNFGAKKWVYVLKFESF